VFNNGFLTIIHCGLCSVKVSVTSMKVALKLRTLQSHGENM